MLSLELKKVKRKKLPLILASIVLVGTAIQYFMGNMTYNGVAYGAELGWFLKNGLIMNSYYLFIPVIFLIGMELFILEKRNNTLKSLLVVISNKKVLIIGKLHLLFIFTIAYIVGTFLSMCFLESMFNMDNMNIAFIVSYLIKYLIHGIVCFISSVFIIGLMLYFKQSVPVTVAFSFVLSFIGLFISQVKIAYLYFVNTMFYISGEVNSAMFEKIIACSIILVLIAIEIGLFSKISHREC